MNKEETAAETMARTLEGVEGLGSPAPDAEGLQAVHERAALVAASGWAPIHLEGRDAADYLHRRLAQSVKKLEPGRGTHALQLSGDGRMECDLLLFRTGETAFTGLVEDRFAESALQLLDKYVLMDEVEVREGWSARTTLVLLGPHAAGVIGEVFGEAVQAACEADRWSAVEDATFEGAEAAIYRDGRWAAPCFQVSAAREILELIVAALRDRLRGCGGAVISPAVFEYARLEQGVTRHGADTDGKTIPLEANLRDAMDLNKGCFPGQEFLARINNLGHPANVLARLRFEASLAPAVGDVVRDPGGGSEVEGRITSVQRLARVDEGLAMATLPWKLRELGEAVMVTGRGEASARVELLGEYPDASGSRRSV